MAPLSNLGSTPSGSSANTKTRAERNIGSVVLGDLSFETWYPSFYPEDVVGKDIERLYVCQWCFKYSRELMPYLAHRKLCPARDAPLPGSLIYSKAPHAIHEVDGEDEPLFAQNLSLFAKLFLDNKSVFFDVSTFNYYLLTASPSNQIVGFFSKEKMSWDNNNLACILVFPPWQRLGLGKILMGVSYELSRREGCLGGPEKPLSELGQRGYRRFWEARIANTILSMRKGKEASVEDVASECWVLVEDVIASLKGMDVLGKKKGNGTVVVSKKNIRDWVVRDGVDLTPPVSDEGFLEEWISGEEMDEQDDG